VWSICIGGILAEKSNAGAEILRNCPELYAPPGSTRLATRGHLRRLEFLWLRELLGMLALGKMQVRDILGV